MEKNENRTVAQNKKAYHDYFVEETYEAGIELFGTEVKSVRQGKINLKDSWCNIVKGEIFVNGYPLTHYTREELAAIFGVSLQNGFLYADTVEENIRFGRELTDEDVARAARIAQAENFISEKEDGYAHLLTQKGTNLSGGQKQRLLIARALAARPPILILDDSSSALDYKTDAALRLALDAEEEKGSTVTVAQRVSSVKSCDLILVLEDGRIIGRGKHEDLLESCPEYREISDSQMGGVFLD